MSNPKSQTGDRRRDARRRAAAPVRMTVLDASVEGVSDNLSGAGLLFRSDRPLRVRVEFEEAGEPRVREGRLVRAERMRGTSTGFAVELDPE